MFLMENKVCIRISRPSKHLPPWFVTNVCINLPFGLSFCHESLGQVNIKVFNFSSIHLSKQSLLKTPGNEYQANPKQTKMKSINRQNCSFSDGICLAQLTFIIAEQRSVMAIAEMNRPLIRLGYYGSACCQSRLKTLCSSSLSRWKYSSKAKRSCLKSATGPSFQEEGSLGMLLVSPSHGLFSKVVFPGHFKKWQSFLNTRKVTQPSQFSYIQMEETSFCWNHHITLCCECEEVTFVRVLWKLEISLWK